MKRKMTPSHFVDSPFPRGEWRGSSPPFEGGVAEGRGGYSQIRMKSSGSSETKTRQL